MSAIMYGLTLASGYVYLRALCFVAEKKGSNFSIDDIASAVNNVLKDKATIKEVFNAAKDSYKK